MNSEFHPGGIDAITIAKSKIGEIDNQQTNIWSIK